MNVLALVHSLALVTHNIVVASSSSSDNANIGLVFFLAGPVFALYVYLRYRNVNKRNMYVAETETTKLNIQAADEMNESLHGLHNSRMQGANNTRIDGAGGIPLPGGTLGAIAGKFESIVDHGN